jgi:GntR family transcriptional regulator
VHGQIEDWLAGEIAVGALVPGDRLPTEKDLAAWFGVSRMTLRHALAELARRGLVTRTVGRHGGTSVAAPKLEQDLTTLAGFSEQLRRHGVVAGARVLTASERPAGPAAGQALQIGEQDPVYEVRRIRLADGRPIAVERSLFPAARFPGMLDCPLDGSLYELLEVTYGLRPHRAREIMEPVTAGAREAEALGVPEGAPLMLVERTAYARSGEPLEYARDLRPPRRPLTPAPAPTRTAQPSRTRREYRVAQNGADLAQWPAWSGVPGERAAGAGWVVLSV